MAPEAPDPVPVQALVEGEDYTLDDRGRLVFTAAYNRRRGYCCFLACRHCPWGQAGRTPAQAAADLERRLAALGERIAGAGLPVRAGGYRNGVLMVTAGDPGGGRAGLEAGVRAAADGLLTVLRIEWGSDGSAAREGD